MVRVRGGGTHRQKLETSQRKQHTTTRREHETVVVNVEDGALMVTEEAHETEDVGAGVESPFPCGSSKLEGCRNFEHELEPLRQSSELEKTELLKGNMSRTVETIVLLMVMMIMMM